MALNQVTAEELKKHLPGRILSFGHPGHIERVDLTGSTLASVDLFGHEGMEWIADLSLPHDFGPYDVVLDPGTIEHCSNPAQAFINAASAVRSGGVIIHESPVTMVNHGYWNLCPSWFEDFYGHNRFKIERMELTKGPSYDAVKIVPWPTSNRCEFIHLPMETCVLVVARRHGTDPITLPLCEKKWQPSTL